MTRGTELEPGSVLDAEALTLIREVVGSCTGLSRKELAQTVCELAGWKRASGRLKALECVRLLERMEEAGELVLPAKERRRPAGSRTRIPVTADGEPGTELVGELGDVAPIGLDAVETAAQRRLYRELVGRHHYLGYAVAYGAQLRYLVYAARPERAVVGCVQFSSAAWRMAARDAWIGWDDQTRRKNLQRVVCNSRLLLLPWIRVRNLASHVLSLATRRVVVDWPRHYGIDVLLVETLVDTSRFRGDCYMAANWIRLGETSGRGRQDREHLRHGAAPKTVFVYPLVKDAGRRLQVA